MFVLTSPDGFDDPVQRDVAKPIVDGIELLQAIRLLKPIGPTPASS